MNDITPAEVFPPIHFVRDELEARGWDEEDIIFRSGLASFEEILEMEIFLAIDPEKEGRPVVFGDSDAVPRGLSNALGTSKEFWVRLQRMYEHGIGYSKKEVQENKNG